MLAGETGETSYLASFGHVPLLSIEDADSAHIVFVELLDQPVPPKNVPILMGNRSKVEPLSNESRVADGWKQVSSNSFISHLVEGCPQDDRLPLQFFKTGWNTFEHMGTSHRVSS